MATGSILDDDTPTAVAVAIFCFVFDFIEAEVALFFAVEWDTFFFFVLGVVEDGLEELIVGEELTSIAPFGVDACGDSIVSSGIFDFAEDPGFSEPAGFDVTDFLESPEIRKELA